MAHVITKLYAFVSVDNEDGDEGIIGFQTGPGMMPMIGSDMNRVESLRKIADTMGLDYKIKTFSLDKS